MSRQRLINCRDSVFARQFIGMHTRKDGERNAGAGRGGARAAASQLAGITGEAERKEGDFLLSCLPHLSTHHHPRNLVTRCHILTSPRRTIDCPSSIQSFCPRRHWASPRRTRSCSGLTTICPHTRLQPDRHHHHHEQLSCTDASLRTKLNNA